MLDRDALHRIYAAKVTDGAPTPEEHLAGLEAVAAAVRGEMRAQLCEALGPVGKGLAWETALGLVDKPERAEVSVEQIKALFAAPLAWDDLCNQPSEERLVRVFNAGRTASDDECHRLRIRNGEARALLTRMVKYCREDKATTPGVTRLARLVDQVADYLNRTRDSNEILRSGQPQPISPDPAPEVAALQRELGELRHRLDALPAAIMRAAEQPPSPLDAADAPGVKLVHMPLVRLAREVEKTWKDEAR